MNKLHDVHMLPTTDSTAIYRGINNKLKKQYHQGAMGQYFHLYSTSDEDKKEGDWVRHTNNDIGRVTKLLTNNEYEMRLFNGALSAGMRLVNARKIGATTNPILTHQDDEYTTYKNLPKIPDSFVQAYIKAYNEGKPITQVLLEYEEETEYHNHEPFRRYGRHKNGKTALKLNPDGSVIWSLKEEDKLTQALEIIKEECEKAGVRQYLNIVNSGYSQVERNIAQRIVDLKEERMYTREEVKYIADCCTRIFSGVPSEFNNWFDKNFPQ
jgi:hypothetical protein